MRLPLAALLALLPLSAAAQQADPARIDPVTGEPRRAFDPTSAEETEVALRACLDRELVKAGAATTAVAACHEATLAACRVTAALYPLATDECDLEQSLAWVTIRHEAGLAAIDGLYAQGTPAATKEAEALVEEDGLWRQEGGNACLDPETSVSCDLAREMERAALYLDRASGDPGDPGGP